MKQITNQAKLGKIGLPMEAEGWCTIVTPSRRYTKKVSLKVSSYFSREGIQLRRQEILEILGGAWGSRISKRREWHGGRAPRAGFECVAEAYP